MINSLPYGMKLYKEFRDPAQLAQIHVIKNSQILLFEFQIV